jgi:hypothetical protein
VLILMLGGLVLVLVVLVLRVSLWFRDLLG